MADRPIKTLSKYEWRRRNRQAQRRKHLELGSYGSAMTISEITKWMKEQGFDLDEAVLEPEVVSDYGDEYARIYVRGWVDVSEDEVSAALDEEHARSETTRQWQERQVEKLRRERPDLF